LCPAAQRERLACQQQPVGDLPGAGSVEAEDPAELRDGAAFPSPPDRGGVGPLPARGDKRDNDGGVEHRGGGGHDRTWRLAEH
jgi:hypothetical protein